MKGLPPGKYEIYVQYAWPKDSAAAPNKIEKDYTIRVYAEEKVKVIDDAGLESISGGGHDKTFW